MPGPCWPERGRGAGASRSQQATLKGLGLRKRTSTVERESGPARPIAGLTRGQTRRASAGWS